MSDFGKALMITAIPIVVLSVTSAAGAALFSVDPRTGPPMTLWVVATLMWVIAVVVAIVFAVKGKRKIAAGIWAGIGIGIVSLGVTCFANFSAMF